jgi:hypothetical protein
MRGLLHRFHDGAAQLALLGQARKYRLTMNIGSLGSLRIGAHGCADALSVTLSATGRELVFDPATARSYGKQSWLGVDRGSRAQPTEAPTRPEWVGPHAPMEDEP